MKPLNFREIELITQSLESLLGARLQAVTSDSSGLYLELYHGQQTHILAILMNPQTPLIFLKSGPLSIKKQIKPIALFIKSNGLGLTLQKILWSRDEGRVIKLIFGIENPLEMEIRLFPHGQNIMVKSGQKKISWNKVALLKTVENQEPQKVRTWDEIRVEFESGHTQQPELNPEQEILKREQIIIKIKSALKQNLWGETGHWLKQHRTMQVPPRYREYVNTKKSLQTNIENCFQKAKQLKAKEQGQLERVTQLEMEIQGLKSGTWTPPAISKRSHIENIKTLQIELSDSKFGMVGKSARDNLELLRAAKSWDLWLHLKDYPGAHGILRRNKNQKVTREDIEKLSKLLATRSKLEKGLDFEVIVTERRFVKPIKGDKLGRATYSNESIYLFRV